MIKPIRKIGNSIGLLFNKEEAEVYGFAVGDLININTTGDFVKKPTGNLKQFICFNCGGVVKEGHIINSKEYCLNCIEEVID